MMPGGPNESYAALGPLVEKMAAHVEGKPAAPGWHDGAGHFVEMVYNGIEYADMQFIAEAFDLMSSARASNRAKWRRSSKSGMRASSPPS